MGKTKNQFKSDLVINNRELRWSFKINGKMLWIRTWSLSCNDHVTIMYDHGNIRILDRGLIRSSPRYGSSPPARLTMEQLWELRLGTTLWIGTHFGSYPAKCRGGPARCRSGPAKCWGGQAKCRGGPAKYKNYRWVAQLAICMAQPSIWGVVAHKILVSAPVPFGFRSYWDLVGVGPKGLGIGLHNNI